MYVVLAKGVNEAYDTGLDFLADFGGCEDSRNGRVKVLPEPLTTRYANPLQRVLFNEKRDANPFFHLFEALWMLAGCNNLHFLTRYNKRMAEFSDDNKILSGAYGYRWRKRFGFDQLKYLVNLLRGEPTTRRAVLQMYDCEVDRYAEKDMPCNTSCMFRIRNNALEMTVICRSNDAVWGAYGANIVHFSILQEFIARAVGVEVGPMYQVSNNFHIYERHWHLLTDNREFISDYPSVEPLFDHPDSYTLFLEDCESLVGFWKAKFQTKFFDRIVAPALIAHRHYRHGEIEYACDTLNFMPSCDWEVAMRLWLNRRNQKENSL